MKNRIRRLFIPIAWAGLGLLLLGVLFLRTADTPVMAGLPQTTGTFAKGDSAANLAFQLYSDDADVDVSAFADDVSVQAEEIQASFTHTTIPTCRGSSIYFIDTSTADSGIDSVEWNFGDGVTSTLSIVEHAYAKAGTYTVWLTATSNISSQDSVSMEVPIEEAIAAIEPVDATTVCQNTPVTFSDASQVTGTLVGKAWYFSDDGSTSTASTVIHSFDTPGTYTVTLTLTTSAGCSDVAETVVTVNQSPAPTIQVSDSSVEVGTTVFFTDTGSGGSTWRWDFGDGVVTPPQATPYASHAYAVGGLKRVVLTVTAPSGCKSVTEYRVGVLEDIYLPMVGNDLIEVYTDDFSNSKSGWPTWKKLTYNSNGTESENHKGGYFKDRAVGQLAADLAANLQPPGIYEEILDDGTRVTYEVGDEEPVQAFAGEPNVYYCLAHDDGDEVFISGPKQTTNDFVYEVKARYSYMQARRWGNEYGILVSKEKVNPADALNVHGYSFQVVINASTDGTYAPSGYVLKRWDRQNWAGGAKRLKGYNTSSYIKYLPGEWNKLRMERTGSTITVYINDHLIGSVVDSTYTGPLYVGFFFAHTRDASYDFMAQWDEVKLTNYY
jgi:PKD repeat protein